MSIGIGLLIAAITTLVGWFTKTEKGANMISGAFKAIGNVVDVLFNKLWNLGETIGQLFSDPIGFFRSLGDDIATAAKEGYNLVQAYDEIEDRQRDQAIRDKENEIQVDRLLLQAKNQKKTLQERMDLLETADRITRASYKEQLALSDDYLKAVQREVAQAEKSGVMGDELADKLKDAKLANLDLIQQEITMEEKIQNRRDQILVKQEKQQEKSNQEKKKEVSEYIQAVAQSEADHMFEIDAVVDTSLAKQVKAIQKRLGATLAANLAEADSDRQLWEQRQQWIDAYQKAEENAKSQILQRGVSLANDLFALENTKSNNAIAAEQRRVDDIRNKFGEESQAYINAQKELDVFKKKQGEEIKKRERIAAEINWLAEVAALWRHAADFGPFQSIVAGIQTAAATIRFRNTIKKINAEQFAKGDVIKGPSHASGGVDVNVEGDEIILTKGVFRNPRLRSIASAINVAAGGKRFAAGGPVSPFTASSSASSKGLPIDGPVIAQTDPALLQRLEDIIASIDARFDRLQVYNNLSDTHKGLQTLQKLSDDASV
ncbi:MAG: hypothetical protein WDO15_09955 [Bacteroidota bacterium]